MNLSEGNESGFENRFKLKNNKCYFRSTKHGNFIRKKDLKRKPFHVLSKIKKDFPHE